MSGPIRHVVHRKSPDGAIGIEGSEFDEVGSAFRRGESAQGCEILLYALVEFCVGQQTTGSGLFGFHGCRMGAGRVQAGGELSFVAGSAAGFFGSIKRRKSRPTRGRKVSFASTGKRVCLAASLNIIPSTAM